MNEQALWSVEVLAVNGDFVNVRGRLADESEIVVDVHKHSLLAAGKNARRGLVKVECTGQQMHNGVPGNVAITLPVPHITLGKRVTTSQRYIKRPSPSTPELCYDTRTFDILEQDEDKTN